MTTFLLIRHAAHDLLGRSLAGRAPGLHLNAKGNQEAECLAERLADARIRALYTSPLERCQETAFPISRKLMIPFRVHDGANEIDFGVWTRKSFPELDPLPEWQEWNTQRSLSRCPGGESMREVQQRIVRLLEELSQVHQDEHVAIVSHGDVIKAALMHYLGLPLDYILRFEIDPASISTLRLHQSHAQILLVNDTGEFTVRHQHDHTLRGAEPVSVPVYS